MVTALPAYRSLWRAARVAFKGDQRMLTAAQSSIRDGFRANAALEPSNPDFSTAIQHAQEVATILRQNVVQGAKHGDETYKLRIHEDTERGDNDSVKFAANSLSGSDFKCCSS
ncbi:mitochondrial zinc maintenance protein 1, mitochondrial [Xylariaceae sp. FL1019]|nr:mitochondrial zinc maintenance protein 1, mitochondrial [Xylariaceae sp. FL1019]